MTHRRNVVTQRIKETKNITRKIKNVSKKKIEVVTKENWIRVCPMCNNLIYYKSKLTRDNGQKLNSTCRPCKFNKQKRETPYIKTCDGCGRNKVYKHASNFFAAIRSSSKCNRCSKIGVIPKKVTYSEWKRMCPRCNSSIFYSRKDSMMSAGKRNSVCRKCADDNHRINMATKFSQNMYPRYNPDACELFDRINKEMGWSGVHALNGGEFYVKELGYWVDYYEPNLNIIIEYDELHHENKKRRMRDIKRQQKITQLLNCKFYRISETESYKWKQIIKEQS